VTVVFTSKRDTEDLRLRIAELERRIDQLAGQVAAVGPLLDDAARLEELAQRATRLSAAADAALQALHGHASRVGVGQARFQAQLDKVHRAAAHGYVAVYYTGGWTDKVRLLVGPDTPPTDCVCTANSTNEINSYAGCVVRAGEYWMVTSDRGAAKSGFVCMFTPLF
jgi:hypothetical protein